MLWGVALSFYICVSERKHFFAFLFYWVLRVRAIEIKYLYIYIKNLFCFLFLPAISRFCCISFAARWPPPLRQNPAIRCDHEVDQEKPSCLKRRRALWSPVPPPWTTLPLPHPPPYPFSQPDPPPRPPCTCEGQATQPWLPAGAPLPSLRRDEPAEAPAVGWW